MKNRKYFQTENNSVLKKKANATLFLGGNKMFLFNGIHSIGVA
jgi:hypothetical protein